MVDSDMDPTAALLRESADIGVSRLFGTHRLAMVRLAILLVDDLDTAEEVAQDAFAALYGHWSTLTSDEAAIGYLRTCVLNGARSVLRRRRLHRRIQFGFEDEYAESADRAVLIAEEHRAVLAALSTLPTRQREVMVLRYWSEMSEPQVAATLGISVGAVKTLSFRARARIAAALGGAR